MCAVQINILFSFTIPPAIIPALHIVTSADCLRTHVIGRKLQVTTWVIVGVIVGINFYMIAGLFAAVALHLTSEVNVNLFLFASLFVA